MRKYFFLILIVFAVVAVNAAFWLWARSDNGDVVLIAAEKRWSVYADGALAAFKVPADLKHEGEPTAGVYWFGEKEQGRVVIFYGRFPRVKSTTFKNQFASQILAGSDCEEKHDKAAAADYRDCDFQGAEFDIIGFEKADVFAALAVNTDYFKKDDAIFILNSLEK